MQVDGDAERLRALPEHIEFRTFVVAPQGVAIDHCALEAILDDGAFQLTGGGSGILQSHVGEGSEASRMACHALDQELVVLARPAHGVVAICLGLHAGHCLRQHDVLDVPRVHFSKALIIEVSQLGIELGDEIGGERSGVFSGVLAESWGGEVLFQRDLWGFVHAHPRWPQTG